MKTIQADISPESLSRAADMVRAKAEELKRAVDNLGSQLAEVGKTIAIANVSVESGELASSIKVEKTADGCQLVADTPYAVYHEFGTGVEGENSPYPYPRPEGVTEPRSRFGMGKNGMVSHSPADEDTWWYYDEKQGRFRATRGQRGKAFMAQAAEAMRQQVRPIASEVIGR